METVEEKLQAKIESLEKRFDGYERAVKIVAAVAAIFGIGGAYGATLISKAHSQIEELQDRVKKLDEVADLAKAEIDNHAASAITKFKTDFGQSLTTEPISLLKVKQLDVVDGKGNSVIVVGLDNDDLPVINIRSPASDHFAGMSHRAVWVKREDSEVAIEFADEIPSAYVMVDGKKLLTASADEDGGMLMAQGPHGEGSAALVAVSENGNGVVVVSTKDGETHTPFVPTE